MAIAKHKKRYQITLTPANVERFQRLAEELGMPRTAMASALDDSLVEIADTFQTIKDQGGKFGVGDLIKLMASKAAEAVEMEELHGEEQKRNKNPKRKNV